mgnify:CR=1 FL=1
MWIAFALSEEASGAAIARQPIYAIHLSYFLQSVHYMRNIGATFQSTMYSVRIEANPSQVLYIMYGFEVLFWRGQDGFVDRSSVLRGSKVKKSEKMAQNVEKMRIF